MTTTEQPDPSTAQLTGADVDMLVTDVEPKLQDNLLDVCDPDWAKFNQSDQEYFLRAAGRAIRAYVGWHLYPNIQQTVANIRTGSRGIIMLPSRYVTEVDSLSISYSENSQPQVIDADDYITYQAGWIQVLGWSSYWNWFGWTYPALPAYIVGSDPFYLPMTQPGLATVVFRSGYTELPIDIKEVAYELATQAMAMRSGNLKQVDAPGGYKVATTQNFGLTLNPEQQNRLSIYRIGMVA